MNTQRFIDLATYNTCGMSGFNNLKSLINQKKIDILAAQECWHDTPKILRVLSPSFSSSVRIGHQPRNDACSVNRGGTALILTDSDKLQSSQYSLGYASATEQLEMIMSVVQIAHLNKPLLLLNTYNTVGRSVENFNEYVQIVVLLVNICKHYSLEFIALQDGNFDIHNKTHYNHINASTFMQTASANGLNFLQHPQLPTTTNNTTISHIISTLQVEWTSYTIDCPQNADSQDLVHATAFPS